MKEFWKKGFKLVMALLLCQLAGFIGSFFTSKSVTTWYLTINKPPITPPGWLFAPVWILLYFMMGIALYFVWIAKKEEKEIKFALILFFTQLVLNTTWSIAFFGLRSPFLGLVNIILLLTALIFTIIQFFKVSKKASYLLLPYLLWLSFATVLNYWIYLIN